MIKCPNCDGTGYVELTELIPCAACEGDGNLMGGPCRECCGSGYLHSASKVVCDLCNGAGQVLADARD